MCKWMAVDNSEHFGTWRMTILTHRGATYDYVGNGSRIKIFSEAVKWAKAEGLDPKIIHSKRLGK